MSGARRLLYKSVRGDRLRRLREKRDLTQGQLSAQTEIAQSYISDMERGVAANVGTEALVPLARVLETSIDYLVGLTEDQRSPARPLLGDLTEDEENLIRYYRAIKLKEVKRYVFNAARVAAEEGV